MKDKLHSLRGQYKREKLKMKAKLRSGAGAEDAISSWYLYDRLRFLDDHTEPKQTRSNMPLPVVSFTILFQPFSSAKTPGPQES